MEKLQLISAGLQELKSVTNNVVYVGKNPIHDLRFDSSGFDRIKDLRLLIQIQLYDSIILIILSVFQLLLSLILHTPNIPCLIYFFIIKT
jgi:hypothetical protein